MDYQTVLLLIDNIKGDYYRNQILKANKEFMCTFTSDNIYQLLQKYDDTTKNKKKEYWTSWGVNMRFVFHSILRVIG